MDIILFTLNIRQIKPITLSINKKEEIVLNIKKIYKVKVEL